MKNNLRIILFLLLLFSFIVPKNVFGEVNENDIKSSLPKMLGANNVGKEFWFTIPPCFEDESFGFANFIKIFVTSAVKTLVTVEVPGKGFLRSRMTIPNDVIEFNITPVIGQAYTKLGRDPNVPEQVYPGNGIHVFANDPLVVYCVVRYRYTSDGFLAIPVSSLGKEYIVAGHKVDAMFRAVWNYKLPNTCGIVAAYDDTKVRFTLGGNPVTKTAGGMKPGQTKEAILMKGDVWMFSTDADEAELTGSKVVANKPVALVTGNQCNNIPTGNQWCDYTVEMDIPTFTWGTDYHVPKVPKRKYSSPIKIFAKEPNTRIYKDGAQIGFLPDAGGIEGRAFLDMRMVPLNVTPRSVVISGDKPIGVTLYNTGVQEDGYPHPNSDPFVMVMTPLQQYQKEITFCTPGIMGGDAFPENYINLVYETDSLGMMPVDMEFAQVQGGQFVWRPLRSRFPGIDELFKYDVEGRKYALKTITLPGDGVYKIRAKRPFAAYSFGYSSYDSYGFPTSAALADLEKPDTVPPNPKWIVECDGTVKGATVTDMPDDAKIRSNLSMIVLDATESYNYILDYDEFIPGETRTTNWSLKVVDLEQDAKAVIVFTDRRGNDTSITVIYKAIKLAIKPNKFNFGTLKTGEVKTAQFQAINESETSPVKLTALKLKSGNEGFKLILPPNVVLPHWLGPKEVIDFTIEFTATQEGSFSDSIGIGDTCFFAYKSRVEAKVGEPVIDVTDVNFGCLTINKPPVNKPFTITNTGTVDLIITGYRGPTDPVYSTDLPPVDANGFLTTPIVIEPKKSFIYNVYFAPTAERDYPDQIVFFNDARQIDSICVIFGCGIAPGLASNSYDWGKRRINRDNFTNDGPYPADNNFPILTIVNTGSEQVSVTSLNQQPGAKNPEAFEFDRTKYLNLVLQPKEELYTPVVFNPKVVGEHIVEFTFENSADSKAKSILQGIGILPVIATTDYDFDTTIVNDFAKKQTRTIRITNTRYQWEDAVTITDLVVNPPGAISVDGVNYGSEGFRFNKASLNLPVTLQPGEFIEFDAEFVASHIGPATASITTVSDAEYEVTSNWTGYGISQFMRISGDQTLICIGTNATLNVRVENYGSGDFKVNSIRLEPDADDVFFENPYDAQGFDMKTGEVKIIKIGYAPLVVGKKTVKVIFNTNIEGKPYDTTEVIVEAVSFTRNTKIYVVKPNLNRVWPTIGDPIPVVIELEGTNDISMAKANELDVYIKYNHDILKVIESTIEIGSAFKGKLEIKPGTLSIDDKKGIITMKLASVGNYIINDRGELLKFTLASLLRPDKNIPDLSKLEHNIQAQGNMCLAMTHTDDEIKLNPTCVYDIRLVDIGVNRYAFGNIVPNPVGSSGTNLEFEIALDGWTELVVFNSKGEVVATPVAQFMTPGKYSVNFPVNDLSSGAYFVRMSSGPFQEVKEMIIHK